MKNKNKQIQTVADLIEALKKVQEKFGENLEVRVWDSQYNDDYDYDGTQSVVNLIVKNDYTYLNEDEDNEKYLILKTY
jgi:hypothetical protein